SDKPLSPRPVPRRLRARAARNAALPPSIVRRLPMVAWFERQNTLFRCDDEQLQLTARRNSTRKANPCPMQIASASEVSCTGCFRFISAFLLRWQLFFPSRLPALPTPQQLRFCIERLPPIVT